MLDLLHAPSRDEHLLSGEGPRRGELEGEVALKHEQSFVEGAELKFGGHSPRGPGRAVPACSWSVGRRRATLEAINNLCVD